jgi:tRNA modification GTPase
LQVLLADLEGSLEFAEAETEAVAVTRERQATTIMSAIEQLQRLLAMAVSGRRLRKGVQVVLVGPPNVGKSSLFNALLGESRVLVDHEPGTTRDVVTARIRREGILFVLHDTAGLMDQAGRVEKMGMELTRQSIDRADVILRLQEAPDQDSEPHKPSILIDKNKKEQPRAKTEELFILTKVDTSNKDNIKNKLKLIGSAILTSSHTGEGLQELWERLLDVSNREGLRRAAALGVVMNARHQQKMVYCLEQLSSLHRDLVEKQPGAEVVASWLAGILSNLGEVSGRVFTENVLDSIFSRFCVGK